MIPYYDHRKQDHSVLSGTTLYLFIPNLQHPGIVAILDICDLRCVRVPSFVVPYRIIYRRNRNNRNGDEGIIST